MSLPCRQENDHEMFQCEVLGINVGPYEGHMGFVLVAMCDALFLMLAEPLFFVVDFEARLIYAVPSDF